jgi:L-lactate dehydrogenase (cytochrome)
MAAARAHAMVFHYIDGGSDDEESLRTSVADFRRVTLVHRVLRDVSSVDTSVRVFGQRLKVPFFFAPSAGNRLFHTEGEEAVARVAAEFGTAYSLSTLSTVSIERVAEIGPDPRWFQLYIWKDRGIVREMIARAKAAGFSALILTADFAVTGNREREIRTRFAIPPKLSAWHVWEAMKRPAWSWDFATSKPIAYANLNSKVKATSLSAFVAQQLSLDFTWRDAEWLLSEWNGMAVLKGVVHPDDARQAQALGFGGVMISNHGGRQLDSDLSPVAALTRIRDAVGPDYDLVLDGGIRRGTDILKALAMGATAVSFARPYLYGLAAGGTAGVRRAAELLATEFRRNMMLAGVPSVADINRDLVVETPWAAR